ncbi:hypothetical protein [Ancylobacter sp. TS-1]|uniref:hypothetical protein n=1 Tax=Ancylobacter sp. TS-1 TaxID=1850374 RepID=UPI001265CEE8|nr:hypothetical protein [Ancylobacter sp. TS-1]QFR34689.1 hypothetical protein GBB76_17145 [Ancylobacter sp. TS-1]
MNDKSATPPQLTVLLNDAGSASSTAHSFRSVEEAVLHCLAKKAPHQAPERMQGATADGTAALPATS